MEDYNIIRTLIVLISGMSILLGFFLFKIVAERQGQLKISDKDSSLELSDVGPGVFFALFGATILISVLITQPYIDTTIYRAQASKTPENIPPNSDVVRLRKPANDTSAKDKVNSLHDYLEGSCLNQITRSPYEEGLDYLDLLYTKSAEEPYAELAKEDKKHLMGYLNKNKIDTTSTSNLLKIKTNQDAYYFFSSYLTNYQIKFCM